MSEWLRNLTMIDEHPSAKQANQFTDLAALCALQHEALEALTMLDMEGDEHMLAAVGGGIAALRAAKEFQEKYQWVRRNKSPRPL